LENRDDFRILMSDKQLITFKTIPLLSKDKITQVYFIIDEFCKEFDKTITAKRCSKEKKSKIYNDQL
jgi:uncharacterized protein YdaU (DUF1376 family)